MPQMDGIEATIALRQNFVAPQSQTPVLGLTANVNPQDLERFTQAGLNAVLLKPFDANKVYEQVEVMIKVKNLPGIHDVVRVQGSLDQAHHLHRAVACFGLQKAHLVQAHAVFTGAGAAQTQSALHQLVVQRLGGGMFFGVVGVNQIAHMKVAIAYVAHQEIRNA